MSTDGRLANLDDVQKAMGPEPLFPRVIDRKTGLLKLEVKRGLEYRIPNDPVKVLGLLDHLSWKPFAEVPGFMRLAIRRIATAKGWEIHPF